MVGFSLGGTAALRLAEAGAVDRVAVGCAPTDLDAVTWRFVRMAENLDGAGVVMPISRLRENFDVWRAYYDMFTLPMIDALPDGLVDGWLDDLSMGWRSDHDRYLAIRSAVWLNANLQGRAVPDMAPLTGDLKADLLLIHNEIDPVVPVSQMVGYQVMVGMNNRRGIGWRCG